MGKYFRQFAGQIRRFLREILYSLKGYWRENDLPWIFNGKPLEDTVEEFRVWVAQRHWRFAKTLWWMPHFYTVEHPATTPEREQFELYVAFIREAGVKVKFNRSRFIKFTIDGWRYWSMGWPIAQTILINRARDDALVLPKPPAPEFTRLTPRLKPCRSQPFHHGAFFREAGFTAEASQPRETALPRSNSVTGANQMIEQYPKALLQEAKLHPKHGYPVITGELALTLMPEQIDALPRAQKGWVRRARRLADLTVGCGVEIEVKASPAPVVTPEAVVTGDQSPETRKARRPSTKGKKRKRQAKRH